MYLLKDYDYELPEGLIAQKPVKQRDRSRLLCLERGTGARDHRCFHELPEILSSGDILVVNEDGATNITKFPFGPEHNIVRI